MKEQHLVSILGQHQSYWDSQKTLLKKYKAIYQVEFYKDQKVNGITVESSFGYTFIESYVAMLFSKQPGVVVGPDPLGTNDPEVVAEVVNRWMKSKRRVLEDATRLALIYPMAFLKLFIKGSNDPLDSIDVQALSPWEVLVDQDAHNWESQRYTGSIYSMPVSEVKKIHGNHKYRGHTKTSYLDNQKKSAAPSLPEEYLYVTIVEVFDFIANELIIWTPDHSSGCLILAQETIPVTTSDERPLSNIVPLYFSWSPDQPLQGLAASSRIYDYIHEINNMRSYWANAIRREDRKYLLNKQAFDDNGIALLQAPGDNIYVPVDLDGQQSLGELVMPIPQLPINSTHIQYMQQLELQLQQSMLLAPFTRGEATQATATEVNALQTYTNSEIGKMSKQKDETQELLAMAYIRMLEALLDPKLNISLEVNSEARVLNKDTLGGKFSYFAIDQGISPINKIQRKQTLTQLAPTLVSLGADQEAVLAQLVRLHDLPEELGKVKPPEPPEEPAVTPGQSTPGPDVAGLIAKLQSQGDGVMPSLQGV